MIERHFLFKALKEINEELTKNKEEFLIDFSSKLPKFFNDQTLSCGRMKRFITEDEILGINLVNEDFYYLDLVIKQNTNDNEYIPYIDKLETDLPVIYVDAYWIFISFLYWFALTLIVIIYFKYIITILTIVKCQEALWNYFIDKIQKKKE